nr:MAG TPA: hypothetical protein [Caudoviricetes sp.]DAQ64090.1 MAG TPA: hypothetical protein [Caudoviricetes sp.]
MERMSRVGGAICMTVQLLLQQVAAVHIITSSRT